MENVPVLRLAQRGLPIAVDFFKVEDIESIENRIALGRRKDCVSTVRPVIVDTQKLPGEQPARPKGACQLFPKTSEVERTQKEQGEERNDHVDRLLVCSQFLERRLDEMDVCSSRQPAARDFEGFRFLIDSDHPETLLDEMRRPHSNAAAKIESGLTSGEIRIDLLPQRMQRFVQRRLEICRPVLGHRFSVSREAAACNILDNMLSRRELLRYSILAASSIPIARFSFADDDAKPFVGGDVFKRLLDHARGNGWSKLALGDAIGRIGLDLSGTPYVGATLELYDDREVCCINLAGLDCVTLFESSLGFARMLRHGGQTPPDLVKEVTFTRYRGGKLDGYLSRLHYTSDWFEDNERKGVVKNLSGSLPGAVRLDKSFDFMSTHPNSYRQLKANPGLVPKIAALEKEISARKPWYVPNDKVADVEPLLQTGDIVGIATSAAGLDCSHTGLIFVDDDKVCRFLNASSVKMQVVLGERLSDYAKKYKRNLGVMIARPL